MRWIALHFGVPGFAAVLMLMLLGSARPAPRPHQALRPFPAAAAHASTSAPDLASAEFLADTGATSVLTSAADRRSDSSINPQPASALHRRVIMMEVTAYCPCKKCCGPHASGITASGLSVTHNFGRFVAADRAFPFHTQFIIPGYNNDRPVPVLDRGGAIKGDKLDVFFPTHEEALKWGRKRLPVTVMQ